LLAAIRRREATGEGSEVRVPLSDVAIGTVANLGGIAEVLYSGENRPRLGNAVYGLFGRDFVARDGVRTMIVVVTHRQWSNLVSALGLGDAVAAIEKARGVSFATNDGLRFGHRDALYPLFENAIGARDHVDLAATLDAAGIVHSAYRNMIDAANDPRNTIRCSVRSVAILRDLPIQQQAHLELFRNRIVSRHNQHRITASTVKKCWRRGLTCHRVKSPGSSIKVL
jgi:crotonobetainyl-CoA:carnitine CoA-transferase CaiB-like acyl-CoA transferase